MEAAGKFRHRIDLEERVTVQDETGDPVVTWVLWAERIPASIEPISVREFSAAPSHLLSQATTKITIRYRPGVVATMRARHGATIYNLLGVLPDRESGRDTLLLPAVSGTNTG
jgi:SPP1 family predicted phage head-tail adaptor